MRKFSILLIISSITLVSCEKEIKVKIPNAEQKIVVEGYIEPNQSPKVLITRSQGYFDAIPTSLNELLQYVVQDAVVTVNDGNSSFNLTPTLSTSYPYFYYTNSSLIGAIGKTYNLTILADGKTLTSSTKIHTPVFFDTLWFKTRDGFPENDSLGTLWGKFQEPPTLGDNYRWLIKVNNGSRYRPSPGNTIEDKWSNGKEFSVISFNPDTNSTSSANYNKDPNWFLFRRGDTIYSKACTIGPAELQFFKTFEGSVGGRGNPFAAPTAVKTNINGGLGIWCGLGAAYQTLITQ